MNEIKHSKVIFNECGSWRKWKVLIDLDFFPGLFKKGAGGNSKFRKMYPVYIFF